jgi:hypothetical protein
MRLHPGTRGRICLGVLVIGGTLLGLWAAFRPAVDPTVHVVPPPRPPALRDARAVVVLRRSGEARRHRAAIVCRGARRHAAGFWAPDPRGACDALASTRGALLAGPGCAHPRRGSTWMLVTGSFAERRFVHRAVRAGCPDLQPWLAVEALALPALHVDRAVTDRTG